MTKFITKILAPFVALIAVIMCLIEIISAINRIKTGSEIVIFVSNTSSSAVKTYNVFAKLRDEFYSQIFLSIFDYLPFLQYVPGVVWDLIRAAIYLYIAIFLIKLTAEL